MKFLLGLFLFSVLLTTGTSLECEICKGVGNCTVKDKFISKECANSDICLFGVITITDGNGSHIRQISTCCEQYDCEPAFPILPERRTRPNGKICPGCSSDKGNCSAAVTECIGSETFCISYITLTEENVVVGSRKGCTREDTCTRLKKFDGGIFHDINRVGDVQCIPAVGAIKSSSAPLSFPLPFGFFLLALLLKKLLL